ncbi:hypothetical protein [[Phormidium] sp. ETS-05]|uniref:hypothetical protein n=1 Tax=[Phormidium] sp. ETS-05 TaxID=222819 RepID=UPI0018EEEADB|nr:hypothetical protein [[Phormidium] sp. ETS-05]
MEKISDLICISHGRPVSVWRVLGLCAGILIIAMTIGGEYDLWQQGSPGKVEFYVNVIFRR